FLTHDEDGQTLVKVLDFGIARAIHGRRGPGEFATAKGLVFGTPGYMSPEQACASPKLDHRCDLWALATIAYETLSHRLPIDGQDTDELMRNVCAGRIIPIHVRRPGLPDAVGAFFDKAFAERIDDRFESAEALAHAFERACAQATPKAARTPRSIPEPEVAAAAHRVNPAVDQRPPTPPVGSRSRARLAFFAGGALLLALPALGGVLRNLMDPSTPTQPTPASAPDPELTPTPDLVPAPAPELPSAPASVHDPEIAPAPDLIPAPPRSPSRAPAPVPAQVPASAPDLVPAPAPAQVSPPHRRIKRVDGISPAPRPSPSGGRPTRPVDRNDVF
ncbi:MAG: serine/threonine protein kinase, partial [Polyangiaceae bacterium]